MAESVVATRAKVKLPGEARGYGVAFARDLLAGETIASVVSVVVAGPDSALTVDAGTVTLATILDDEGNPIGPGLAVIVRVSGGTAKCDYRITLYVTTSLGNTIGGVVVIQIRNGLP